MTSRAFGATRFVGLLGLIGLLAACGGGSSSGPGGGGSTPPPPVVTLASIFVGPASASVVAGLTLQFTATGVYSDGTQKDISSTVTWMSSDTSKAIISMSGLATGVVAGTTTITAAMSTGSGGSVSGTDTLTVVPPNLLSVVISPNAPYVPVGRVLQFSAIGKYTNGTTNDLTASVAWASSNPAVTAVSAAGVATAASLGTADISASMTGGPAITPVTMTVTAKIYAYATNFDEDTVSQYILNSSDGSLTPLSASTVTTDHQPFSISIEPTGEYVYVSNWGSSTVSQFRIGADGTLSVIGTAAVQCGSDPNAVTIDHANRFAYVANLGDSTISQYKIGLDGQLAPMTAPTVPTGANPASVITDPTDHFAYVGNFGANAQNPPPGPGTISQYSIGTDGSLTPMSTATVVSGSGPNALTIDPARKYLYAANLGDNNVGQYTINSDGSLTAMTPSTVPAGTRPFSITIDPTGSYVYVANQVDGTISQYAVGAGGALAAMSTPFVTAGAGVSAVSIDPTGKYLYATNRGTTTISQFQIGAGGALTPMTSPTVASGLHPTSIATGY